ncbi:MAG TPA: HAD family hydrolase [Gammaproteobacteria bacterium]|nr:HAD family hydrolase [Gammaproteobacteria bacterium]
MAATHRPQALIFDVDGTLADTERLGHLPAFNAAFAEAGLDWRWSPELYRRLLSIAGGRERIRHYIRHCLPPGRQPSDVEALVEDLHLRKNRIYAGMLEQGRIVLRPGVERLLREARAAGMDLAIATTSGRANVLALLDCTLGEAARDWFRVMATADEVEEKKPSPQVYQHVREALALPPERCLVFEDSENGLRAAQGAGLECLITVNAFTRDGDYEAALLVVDHLGEPELPCSVLGGRRRACFDMSHPWVDLFQLERLLG